MAADDSTTLPKQLRLAFVLNGGVSLAVWMAGVAHEVDVLRRAACGEETGVVAEEWERLLTASPYSDVIVDIVAGTSAGGLNGTLLANAIARGSPLPDLRRVWIELAQLDATALLSENGFEPRRSLLNGAFFEREISRLLRESGDAQSKTPPQDICLYVTATAIGSHSGNTRKEDDFGQPFTVADHRRLYRFRRSETEYSYTALRTGWQWDEHSADDDEHSADDFAPSDEEARIALANAARASAGYPLAFPPVVETLQLKKYQVGRAAEETQGANQVWLIDGGVLDNAPFRPVLDEIAGRPVTTPWRRVVCYVVPSTGLAPPSAAQVGGTPPWTPVLRDALQLPNEVDLRTDIAAIKDQQGASNIRSEAGDQLFRELLGDPVEKCTTMFASAETLFPKYREARAVAMIKTMREEWLSLPDQRDEQVTAAVVKSGPGVQHPWLPTTPYGDELGFADDSERPSWHWGVAVAGRVIRTLLAAARSVEAPVTELIRVQTAITKLSQSLRRVESVGEVLIPGLKRAGSSQTPLAETADVADGVYRSLHISGSLGEQVAGAVRAYAELTQTEPSRIVRALLAIEILSNALSVLEPRRQPIPFELLRLGPEIDGGLLSGQPATWPRSGTGNSAAGASRTSGPSANRSGGAGTSSGADSTPQPT